MDAKAISDKKIKEVIKERYTEVINTRSCCGTGNTTTSAFKEDYTKVDGYVANADYNLGCGLPTEHAAILEGDHVLDLGCGAGNDVFIARSIVGESGKVVGLDMTEDMLKKAEENKTKLGYSNIEFVLGEIEDMPLEDNQFDVVVSNCVLNLVPNKNKAYQEVYRVLKPTGHFCMSDVVLTSHLSNQLKDRPELYASCVSGALLKEDYEQAIKDVGFKNIEIVKERPIILSDEKLKVALTEEELTDFRSQPSPVLSITIKATK
ncbi:arsenite methyltransferase [Flavobacteriaceae bacterium MHTCC 0001]